MPTLPWSQFDPALCDMNNIKLCIKSSPGMLHRTSSACYCISIVLRLCIIIVGALCYKPESRGFDYRRGHCNPVSTRNISLGGGEGGRWVGLCRLSWYLGASTSWNPKSLSRSVQGLLFLYYHCNQNLYNTAVLLPQRIVCALMVICLIAVCCNEIPVSAEGGLIRSRHVDSSHKSENSACIITCFGDYCAIFRQNLQAFVITKRSNSFEHTRSSHRNM